ncbi:MAG: SDR family oxidoreductase [Acidimicrobiales bacterium]
MDLDGAVCIVTGASSGIGASTARRLADAGASVVLAARRAERITALAGELPDALAVPTDVTVASQLQALVSQALEVYGHVDVLVNNAGQGLHVPLADVDPDDVRAVLELNVVAPLVALQAVLPAMRARARGAVVNVSSATSLYVRAGLGAYTASKAALNTLSEVERLELGGAGVVVSAVYPSLTATEFHEHLRAGAMVPGGRTTAPDPPELVAQAVVFAIATGTPHVLVASPPRSIPCPVGLAPGT